MKLEDVVNGMRRSRIVRVLKDEGCIQCYDHESVEVVAEALIVNVKDGTIDASVLNEWAEDGKVEVVQDVVYENRITALANPVTRSSDKATIELRLCALSWQPQVRLLGNVTCGEIVDICTDWIEAMALLRRLVAMTDHAELVGIVADARHCFARRRR